MRGWAIFILYVSPCDGLAYAIRSRVSSRATVAPALPRALIIATDGGLCPDEEFLAYWSAHSNKWATPLQILDVYAAWECGELDGILPSGAPSRAATERMLTLNRAVELFEKDQLQVRRRFRNMTPVEMASRWERVMATRTRLQNAGTWEDIVRESDSARAYERAIVRGEVEDADASPVLSRVIATLLSPALKAAATQRSRADGGMRLAFAELLETAGDEPSERWLTAVLLAELEGEVADLPPAASRAAASPSFAEQEAQRDVEQANSFGLFGVGVAVIAVLAQALGGAVGGGGGGGGDDALQRTLNLMQ
jgi:hypothetical protein